MQMITKPHCQQALFETRLDRKIKTLTNSRSVQCFYVLSSFRFIYFPHGLVNYAFSYNLVTADFNKIRVCRRINVRSRVKRVLEATLSSSVLKALDQYCTSIFLGRWPMPAASRDSIQFHTVSYCSAIKRYCVTVIECQI